MKTVNETNKIIAEFMGALTTDAEGNIKEDLTTLKYHTSWDWLMPVVQKILVLKNTYGQERQKVFKAITPDIRITYTAVIAFIEWHNAQQPLTN